MAKFTVETKNYVVDIDEENETISLSHKKKGRVFDKYKLKALAAFFGKGPQ